MTGQQQLSHRVKRDENRMQCGQRSSISRDNGVISDNGVEIIVYYFDIFLFGFKMTVVAAVGVAAHDYRETVGQS